MKKNEILIIAICAVASFLIASCDKEQFSNPPKSEINDNSTGDFDAVISDEESEVPEIEEDEYQAEAGTKIDSIETEHGRCHDNGDVNGCGYVYSGLPLVKYNTELNDNQKNKFIVELSQKDTLLNKFDLTIKTRGYTDTIIHDTITNILTRIDDTHYSLDLKYRRDGYQRLYFSFYVTPKNGVSKKIKKTIRAIPEYFDNRSASTHVLFNNERWGTTKYWIQKKIIDETSRPNQPLPNLTTTWVNIDSTYNPQESDIIKLKEIRTYGEYDQYMYLANIAGEPNYIKCELSEMNSNCKSNRIVRSVRYKRVEFWKKLKSRSKLPYVVHSYKRIF